MLYRIKRINVPFMNIKTWIATGALAVVVVGGSITGATVHNAQVQADAARIVQVKADAQQAVAFRAESAAAATAQAAAVVAADASYAQYLADQKAAAVALAAQQAQAAADAAAQATAAQAVAAPVKQRTAVAAPTAPTGSSKVASGQPVPMMTNPDGSQGPDTTQCASGSASNVNGVPTCD